MLFLIAIIPEFLGASTRARDCALIFIDIFSMRPVLRVCARLCFGSSAPEEHLKSSTRVRTAVLCHVYSPSTLDNLYARTQ